MEAQVVYQESPKLLDRLRAEIRLRHDSLRISRRVWLRTPLRYQGKFVLKIRVAENPQMGATHHPGSPAALLLHRQRARPVLSWTYEYHAVYERLMGFTHPTTIQRFDLV